MNKENLYFTVFYKKLGTGIKALCEEKHLIREKLAEKAGISLDYLGKIEVNIDKPELNPLLKPAWALDITIEELFRTF